MIGRGLFDVFLHPTAENEKSMCVTLGSDRNTEFYRGANFFENVKFDEKTCFSTVKLKFMIRIGLFDVFLHQTAEPDKSMCVTLGSDRNSEFYRCANFFENIISDEKTCFATKKLKFLIGIGLYDVFPHRTAEPEKSMCVRWDQVETQRFTEVQTFLKTSNLMKKRVFRPKNSNS